MKGIMMRTTLTIDDPVAASLQDWARRSGKPYKLIVNEALRLGLREMERPRAQPYKLVVSSLGPVQAGLDLNKALAIADGLEDKAIAQEIMLRK